MADSLDYLLIKWNQTIYDVHISYIIIKINATKYLSSHKLSHFILLDYFETPFQL